VDDGAVNDGPTGDETPAWVRRIYAVELHQAFTADVVLRNYVEQLSIETERCAEESIAQRHGMAHYGVEGGLRVRRGPGDGVQNLTHRRPPRQRLLQSVREIRVRRNRRVATPNSARGAAIIAEFRGWAIFVLARGTLHAEPPISLERPYGRGR
jgi:hypothetical protein